MKIYFPGGWSAGYKVSHLVHSTNQTYFVFKVKRDQLGQTLHVHSFLSTTEYLDFDEITSNLGGKHDDKL